MTDPAKAETVSIEIDGVIYDVEADSNLLQACLSQGLDLPYFCWHPAMGSVGACRQCAIVVYQDRHDQEETDTHDEQGRIVMGCMTPVSEGMRLSINTPTATSFRSNIVELLMTNHPHDCPVCEEGGECHLQDMTVMTGHTARQYSGTKRTHVNQYLGPFINHEMNRCIACYRCVRYYQDYAGGHDLQAMASHNHVYFGRHEDGVLDNEFSGNLVEVCPTGVFTDKTLSQRYSRKWDLQATPSICTHCAVGCNISPGERYGEIRRVVNRYNHAVNGYFLCDRGRFGYGFVNHDRLQHAANINNGEPDKLNRNQIRDALVNAVGSNKRLLGIGSPRASLEANFALQQLVGNENFHAGLNRTEHTLLNRIRQVQQQHPMRIPNLPEIEQADAVLILGEDLINTTPRIALAVRQAANNAGLELADELRIPRWQDEAVREAAQQLRSPIYSLTTAATRIDDIATATWFDTPDALANLGFAIAHAINNEAPSADPLEEQQSLLIHDIADRLREAKRPLIISGTGCHSEAIIQAAANIAGALALEKGEPTDLYYCVPEANSLGLSLLTDENKSLAEAAAEISTGQIDSLVILENDLFRRLPPSQAAALFDGDHQVVSLDHHIHATALNSDLVLPVAPFTETDGTLVSGEGRAQRFFTANLPQHDVRGSWEWLADMIALRKDDDQPAWQHLDEVTAACAQQHPVLASIVDAAPDADFRAQGMKIARQPHRYSGRTAMRAGLNVSEPKQPVDEESALGFTMEGYPGEKPAALTPYYWSPGWNSNQSVGKFQQEINGSLQGGDPGVRLIESNGNGRSFFTPTGATTTTADHLLTVPIHHIFGSEEQSALSSAIAERTPFARAELNPADAQRLGVEAGDGLCLTFGDDTFTVEVAINTSRPANSVGVSSDLPQTLGLPFLNKASASKAEDWQRRPELNVIASDAVGTYTPETKA